MSTSLVIQLARFGDIVQTKRLIASLAARPDSKVHLLVDDSLCPLAKLIYPKVFVHGIRAHGTKVADSQFVREAAESCRKLQEIKAHEVFNLNFSGLNMALGALFEPEQVRGYWLEHGQRRKDAWAEMGFRLAAHRQIAPLNLVDLWAGYLEDPLPPEQVNPPARGRGGGVGIVLAGRESGRSLNARTLALLASAALERVGHGPIFLLGTSAESRRAREVRTFLRPAVDKEVQDLSGKTHWQGLIDCVQHLDLLLTPDTGTMHLAAHLGVPVMAFFLGSAWCHETGPYGQGHTVIQHRELYHPHDKAMTAPQKSSEDSPFASRFLLRYVAKGSIKDWGDDLTLFTTALDKLGVFYVPQAGQDAFLDERQSLRELVAAHRHLVSELSSSPAAATLRHLYREKDWMLQPSSIF